MPAAPSRKRLGTVAMMTIVIGLMAAAVASRRSSRNSA